MDAPKVVEAKKHVDDLDRLDEGASTNTDTIKAWFNSKTNHLYMVPEGMHHCGYLVNHPDEFDFERVYGFSVETYFNQFWNYNMLPPEYDDTLVGVFLDEGLVRIGYDYENMPSFYVEARSLQKASRALRAFYPRVSQMMNGRVDDRVTFSTPEADDEILEGRRFQAFMKNGVIPSRMMSEASIEVPDDLMSTIDAAGLERLDQIIRTADAAGIDMMFQGRKLAPMVRQTYTVGTGAVAVDTGDVLIPKDAWIDQDGDLVDQPDEPAVTMLDQGSVKVSTDDAEMTVSCIKGQVSEKALKRAVELVEASDKPMVRFWDGVSQPYTVEKSVFCERVMTNTVLYHFTGFLNVVRILDNKSVGMENRSVSLTSDPNHLFNGTSLGVLMFDREKLKRDYKRTLTYGDIRNYQDDGGNQRECEERTDRPIIDLEKYLVEICVDDSIVLDPNGVFDKHIKFIWRYCRSLGIPFTTAWFRPGWHFNRAKVANMLRDRNQNRRARDVE